MNNSVSIANLISKFQAATNANWKTRYLNELKDRKSEVKGYFNSLSATEEQQIQPVITLIES